MEPNNEYLCIVSDQSKKEQDVFLPFEGDKQLSIILSKAFMLVSDYKISDKTITSQISKWTSPAANCIITDSARLVFLFITKSIR